MADERTTLGSDLTPEEIQAQSRQADVETEEKRLSIEKAATAPLPPSESAIASYAGLAVGAAGQAATSPFSQLRYLTDIVAQHRNLFALGQGEVPPDLFGPEKYKNQFLENLYTSGKVVAQNLGIVPDDATSPKNEGVVNNAIRTASYLFKGHGDAKALDEVWQKKNDYFTNMKGVQDHPNLNYLATMGYEGWRFMGGAVLGHEIGAGIGTVKGIEGLTGQLTKVGMGAAAAHFAAAKISSLPDYAKLIMHNALSKVIPHVAATRITQNLGKLIPGAVGYAIHRDVVDTIHQATVNGDIGNPISHYSKIMEPVLFASGFAVVGGALQVIVPAARKMGGEIISEVKAARETLKAQKSAAKAAKLKPYRQKLVAALEEVKAQKAIKTSEQHQNLVDTLAEIKRQKEQGQKVSEHLIDTLKQIKNKKIDDALKNYYGDVDNHIKDLSSNLALERQINLGKRKPLLSLNLVTHKDLANMALQHLDTVMAVDNPNIAGLLRGAIRNNLRNTTPEQVTQIHEAQVHLEAKAVSDTNEVHALIQDLSKFPDQQIKNLPSRHLASIRRIIRSIEHEPTLHAYLKLSRITKLIDETYPPVNIWKTQMRHFTHGEHNLSGESLREQIQISRHTSDLESEINHMEGYLKRNLLKKNNRLKMMKRLQDLKKELATHSIESNKTNYNLLKDTAEDLHLLSEEMHTDHTNLQTIKAILVDDLQNPGVPEADSVRASFLNENPGTDKQINPQQALNDLTERKVAKEEGRSEGTEKDMGKALGQVSDMSIKPDEEVEEIRGGELKKSSEREEAATEANVSHLTEERLADFQKKWDWLVKHENNHEAYKDLLTQVTTCLTGNI